MTGERALWVHVLLTALHDLTSTRITREAAMAREDVERWVGPYPSREFAQVCTLAGLDPDAAHDAFRKIITEPHKRRRASTTLAA